MPVYAWPVVAACAATVSILPVAVDAPARRHARCRQPDDVSRTLRRLRGRRARPRAFRRRQRRERHARHLPAGPRRRRRQARPHRVSRNASARGVGHRGRGDDRLAHLLDHLAQPQQPRRSAAFPASGVRDRGGGGCAAARRAVRNAVSRPAGRSRARAGARGVGSGAGVDARRRGGRRNEHRRSRGHARRPPPRGVPQPAARRPGAGRADRQPGGRGGGRACSPRCTDRTRSRRPRHSQPRARRRDVLRRRGTGGRQRHVRVVSVVGPCRRRSGAGGDGSRHAAAGGAVRRPRHGRRSSS